jgi:drug/metabolite transporter (DMT)-like permease
MDRDASATLRAYAILVFMPLFFSSNLVIGRAAVAEVEPWTLAFWRWLLAFLILLPAAWPGLKEHRDVLRREWRSIALLGFLGMWLCGGVVYLSLRHTTATNGILIYTSSPVFILLMEIVFRGQNTSLRQVVGIALAFLGVAAILLRGDIARLLALEFNPGDIGMAVAAISWAVYSVVLKRAALTELPTVVLFAAIALGGWILLTPMVAWDMIALGHFPQTAHAWASIVGLAVVPSVLAYSSYQYGVKMVGPTVTGIFLYLLPAYGVVMAVLLLNEAFELFHAAGLVLVSCGVVLATAPAIVWQRLLGRP